MKTFIRILILLLFTQSASAAELVTVGDVNQSYTDTTPSFLAGSDYVAVHQSTGTLPHKFDWRDEGVVTSTKDQTLKCGACYAFAMTAALESAVAKQTHVKYDLSENHVMNCNWAGSACLGGTSIMVANLWTHSGAVLEKDDPFYPGFSMCTRAKPVYRVTEWLQISAEKMPPTDTLKRYIMEYGPIYTQLDGMPIPYEGYDGSYVLSAINDLTTNHAMVIIGWDDGHDNISTTGHWLVKNAWGSTWGDDGIGRIGYKRYEIGKYSSVVSEFVPYSTTSREYAHDEAGLNGGIGYKNSKEAQGLAIFDIGSDTIDEVQFWATGDVKDLDIRIYDNFNGTAVTGNLLYLDTNLKYNEAGVHTVKLKYPVKSSTGKFVLVMNIRIGSSVMAGSKVVPIPIDVTVSKVNTTFISQSVTNPYMLQGIWEDTSKIALHGNIVFRLRSNTGSDAPVTRSSVSKRVDNTLLMLDTLDQSVELNQIVNVTPLNLVTDDELEMALGEISDKIDAMRDRTLFNRILDRIRNLFGVNNE